MSGCTNSFSPYLFIPTTQFMIFFLTGAASVWELTGKGLPPDHRAESRVPGKFKQLLRVMKLTSLILLIVCMAVNANGDAQQRIAINVKNVSLQKLFAEIEKKTSYTFFYDVTILKETKPVTVALKDATVEEVLRQALIGQALEYTITDKTIFVKKERKAEVVPVDTSLHGAGVKVRGVVLTEAGVPVQGANVTVKQTEKGTITNAKGEFELSYAIPAGSILIFSYVGYAPQNIAVKDGGQIRVYMKVAQNELDKAVVKAYGTTTQRLTTADIGTVTAEEIERQPVMNPLLALEGKIAGLDVNMTSGYASAPIKVELRGRASIGISPSQTFPSDPLYIVDGVPLTINEVSGLSSYSSGSFGFDQYGMSPAGGQSPFFSINPADIESIEVLKDADATAIYGSRGANGVILVTTKKGKAGKTKFDLHAQEGTTHVDRFWNMLNTTQYLAMRRQAYYNTGTNAPNPINDYDINGDWDTTRYTNWQKVLYGGTGRTIDIQGSLSGGDAHTTFRVGAGYNRTTGITTVSGADQRGSMSLSLTHHSLDQRLSISSSNGFTYAQSNLISLPPNVLLPPDAPSIYDSVGNLNWAGWGGKNQNSLAENNYPFGSLKIPYTAKTNFLNSNLVIGYELIRGLELSTSFGYNIAQQNQEQSVPIASQDPLKSATGALNIGSNRNINWIVEPQMTYNSEISKGKLGVLLGASSTQNNTESESISGTGYTSDLLINNLSSASSFRASDLYGEYRYFGVFGRVSYNWEDKYILNLNARRDGSSRFGPGKQFGNFGSVGAAWIVSEEEWLKKRLPFFISFAKFRGSFGTTGSDAVPNYSYLSQYSSNPVMPYDNNSALVPLIDPNPNFRWQSNKSLEGAVNLGFLKDRITAQAAWYRNRCGNQLVPFPTPSFTGFSSVIENSPALVQNTGWEFTASANLVKLKKFSWTVNFNMSINRNKLVSYPDFALSPFTTTLKVGMPLNITHVLHYIGIDPQTGNYSFLDKNHDGIITWDPGSPLDDSYPLILAPKYFGGVGMNFTYKSLNANLFFNFKNQIGKNAYSEFINPPGSANSNQPEAIWGKQWQYPGDKSASITKFTTIYSQSDGFFAQSSDGANTSASFIRLSNLSISYSLPNNYLRKASIQGCSLFFHTNNLFVITKYKGLDPETQNFGGLPPVKEIVGGINFNF
jgi:TonB-linked SusC/RagA family outer membrane protein